MEKLVRESLDDSEEKYTFYKRKNRNGETQISTEDYKIGGMLNSVDTGVISFLKDKKVQEEFEKYCNDHNIPYGHFFGAEDILAISKMSQYFNIVKKQK